MPHSCSTSDIPFTSSILSNEHRKFLKSFSKSVSALQKNQNTVYTDHASQYFGVEIVQLHGRRSFCAKLKGSLGYSDDADGSKLQADFCPECCAEKAAQKAARGDGCAAWKSKGTPFDVAALVHATHEAMLCSRQTAFPQNYRPLFSKVASPWITLTIRRIPKLSQTPSDLLDMCSALLTQKPQEVYIKEETNFEIVHGLRFDVALHHCNARR